MTATILSMPSDWTWKLSSAEPIVHVILGVKFRGTWRVSRQRGDEVDVLPVGAPTPRALPSIGDEVWVLGRPSEEST